MTKNSNEISEDIEKLKFEKEELQQQLLITRKSLDAINTHNIDGLVITHENDLKVYTEKTADKSYRILIEKMHEGAVILDEKGRILYCNFWFAKMVKQPLEEIIGTKFANHIDNSVKEHIEAMLEPDNLNALKEEVYLYAGEGKKIPVLMTINALFLDNIYMLSVILTDLTVQNENKEAIKSKAKELEQKNLELENSNIELIFQYKEKEKRAAELVIADKELEYQALEKKKLATELSSAESDVKELESLNAHKEIIISTLSHDLRSPLSGIIGIAKELKENFETMKPVLAAEMLDMLHKASVDELIMLDQLVEWARIKYASEAFSPQKIRPGHFVAKVFNSLNENASAKNIKLYNEIDDTIIVFADGNMLQSILQNIVSNSIKHTPAGGKVTVSTDKINEDKITIKIIDNGIGMSKAMQEQLFKPQLGALSNLRKENKGAGIGLLLVNAFVQKNGGKIWVESVEGEGTSVFFTLRNSRNETANPRESVN